MREYWKSRGVTIRGAIISGLFVLLAGLCTIIAALIYIYPDLRGTSSGAKETNTKVIEPSSEITEEETKVVGVGSAATEVITVSPETAPGATLPSLAIEKPRVFTDWRLETQVENQPISIVPLNCWVFSGGELSKRVESVSSLNAMSSLIVISSEAAIIQDVQVLLDEYIPPSLEESFEEVQVDLGEHGGAVSTIDLGSVSINSRFEEGTLTPLEAYYLEDQDALRFQFSVTFLEPGQYKYHVSVDARTAKGEQLILESAQFYFHWILFDDFISKRVVDSYTKDPVTLTSCQ
jgi:hypothetical protein